MKQLSLEQSLSQILSAPQAKAKLNLKEVWPKVQPFLMMLAMLIPKIAKYINGLIAGIEIILGAPAPSKAAPNLPVLWNKVRPFVVMLGSFFGKKVGVYINAFVAAIDAIVDAEE